jgi:hypothetical protein
VNLRREHVVNFVSEHIKASAILEKNAAAPAAVPGEGPRRHRHLRPHARVRHGPGRLILFDTDADGISRFGDERYTFTFDSCPGR